MFHACRRTQVLRHHERICSPALVCKQPTRILVQKWHAMRCNDVRLRLHPHCSSQTALLQQASNHMFSSGEVHEVASKTRHIHTCVITRIDSANRYVRRGQEVCFSPASAPHFVNINAATSMKQFVLSRFGSKHDLQTTLSQAGGNARCYQVLHC